MRTATVEDGKSAGIKLAHIAAKAAGGKILAEDLVEAGKKRAEDLIETGTRTARRLYKQGYEMGEDYIDESRRYIKKNPWQSVGVALGVGLAVGFVAGLLSRRN